MSSITYCQRNRGVILNRARDYYGNDKKRLKEQAKDKYRKLSEEDKNKKREYGRNRYNYIKTIKRLTGLNTIINIYVI